MPSEVVLSRRNLLSLLHKLEMPGSFCTIVKPDGTAIKAERDEVHYANRIGGPGTMHPDTEQFVADLEEALKIVRRKRAAQIAPTVGKAIEGCASASRAKEASSPVITVTNPNPVPPDMPVAFTSIHRRAEDVAWPTCHWPANWCKMPRCQAPANMAKSYSTTTAWRGSHLKERRRDRQQDRRQDQDGESERGTDEKRRGDLAQCRVRRPDGHPLPEQQQPRSDGHQHPDRLGRESLSPPGPLQKNFSWS